MAEVGYFLNKRDRRNFLDMMRQRGRLRSGPLQRRARKPRSISLDTSSSSSIGEETFGLLIKNIAPYEIVGYHKILPSFTSKGVVVLSRINSGSLMYFANEKAEAIEASEFESEQESEEDEISKKTNPNRFAIDVINPIWPMEIVAGTGEEDFSSEESGPQDTFQFLPVVVTGFQVRNIDDIESETSEASEVVESVESENKAYTKFSFVLTDVILPVTFITGHTTAAVDGGDFDIILSRVLWGRNPYVEAQSDFTEKPIRILNPDNWTSDAGAYCVAIQLDDGRFWAVDLACKQEAESESET